MSILLYSDLGKGEGGGEAVFERVANGLEKKGYDIIRLYRVYNIKVGFHRRTKNSYDINLSVPSQLRTFLKLSFLRRFVFSFIGLLIILIKTKPKTVNCHFFSTTAFYFAFFKKIFGYRFVLSCHGTDVNQVFGLKKDLAPYILNKCDAVTFVSNDLKKKLTKKVSTKFTKKVIYNGVDLGFWNVENVNKGNNDKRKTIITTGKYRYIKGHDVLIESFKEVTEEYPTVLLKIVGDGDKRTAYEALIKENNLEHYIELTGWVTPVEVREELYKASLFVFPSRREGFGLALVEAMAMGLPIISSRTGGLPEVLEDVDAILVEPDDSVELANALKKGLKNTDWQNNARETSLKKASKFSWERTVNGYTSVLTA